MSNGRYLSEEKTTKDKVNYRTDGFRKFEFSLRRKKNFRKYGGTNLNTREKKRDIQRIKRKNHT